MFHGECKPGCHKSQDSWATEPCSKKMKSTDEPYGKSYEGLQNFYEDIHVKKTHSGFIPLSLSDEEEALRENEIAEVLDPSKQNFSDKKAVSAQPLESLCNVEVMGKSPADVVGMKHNNTLIRDCKNKGETNMYSTSKAFIGPLYKNEADCQPDGSRKAISSNTPEVIVGRRTKKKMTPKHAITCDVSKIEDELTQFYTEINHIEYDEYSTDFTSQKTEANAQNHPVEYNKLNPMQHVSPQDWSHSRTSAGGGGGGQCFYNKSSYQRTFNEQYSYSDPNGSIFDNSHCHDDGRKAQEAERLHNRQAGSTFWNDCMPQFKSGWPTTNPFIIPYGPPPPQFRPPFDFQRLNSPSHQSDTFYPSNVGFFENTHFNMSNSVTDQNSEYNTHFGTPKTETTKNVHNVPDGQMDNGFCETKPCWKDLKTSSTVSHPFPDSNFCDSQKLIIILRGLPGSGKTTLSRLLLGQSRDGIVFSTDDYFRQQDGYWSYNVGQLGAAHEWNQKRAKQAMDQGRTPIIIDNTNTQAWEMKPYVETALENGYKVEFQEPNTWWKFDSEELEKRNEHGVSREKITQMLERYDFQISIPIVLNSVVPFYKTAQRQQRRQREIGKKKHQLRKILKLRRKLKRNREMKTATIKAVESKSKADFTPGDEDSSQSRGGELEIEGITVVVTGHPCEPKKCSMFGCASTSGPEELLQKGCLNCEIVDPATLDNSLNTSVPLQNGVNNNNMWDHSIQSSALKFEYNSKETISASQNVEEEVTFARPSPEFGAQHQLLDSEKEVTISCNHKKSKIETNSGTFCNPDLADKQKYATSDKYELCFTLIDDISKVICDQRSNKLKKPEKVFSEGTTESTKHNSDKEPNGDGDEDFLYVDNAVPLELTDNINKISSSKIGDFSTESVTVTTVPKSVNLHPHEKSGCPSRNKGRYKRIFKLAPQFDIPRHVAVGIDEKVIQDVNVLVFQEDFMNEDNKKKNEQTLGGPGPSKDVIVVKSSPLDIKPVLLCYDSKQLEEKSEDMSNSIIASPVQINTSVSYEDPLPIEIHSVTDEKIGQTNTEEKKGKISLDVSSSQPDILHSVNVVVERLQDSSAECAQQINEMKQSKYSETCDGQDSLSTKSSLLKLPLSLGFALQLVELFGSPGVPLDTLLPHDYVVPLDWATSKEIHLQWKTSVEKKQNKNQLKEDHSLPVGAAALEDSNEGDQESHISLEAVP